MVTTGVIGGSWRATVEPSGAIVASDGTALRWFVAADDRWHVPEHEPTVRQRRLAGTPVTETRVRVPTGDVVQVIYSTPDAGGVTAIEVSNESTMPVAIAFDRRDVLTERPIADVPIEGIELPAAAFVQPLGHRARLRVALAHDGSSSGRLPSLPSADAVVAGWRTVVDRASRLELPDGALGAAVVEQVVATRCELLLGALADPFDDPDEFLVGLGELVRLGEPPSPWVEDVASAVEVIAPEPGWRADVALAAAARLLTVAGEARAGRDLARIRAARRPSSRPAAVPPGASAVPWLETMLAAGGTLFPDGIPESWWGQSIEAHGVPTGPASAVSFALRWHADRPAVLWEQLGEPIELAAPVAAPGWVTTERAGETLWPAPAADPER